MRAVTVVCLAVAAVLTVGCPSQQQAMIRHAERESLSRPPRNVAWDYQNSDLDSTGRDVQRE